MSRCSTFVAALLMFLPRCPTGERQVSPMSVPFVVASIAGLPAEGPPPLTAEDSVIDLPIEGHLPAVAAIPLGVAERRPVAVIAHGMWGGPQWDCPLWRGVLGGSAFLLCVRGVPRLDQPAPESPSAIAYTYASPDALHDEITAALAALRSRFGPWIEDGPVLYVGCSLGAHLGATLATRDAVRSPRLVLVEGGHDRWTPTSAKHFAESGGERVLFVCGQEVCSEAARAKAHVLKAAGVEALVVDAPRSGHICHGRVAEAAQRALPWILAGDPRWGRGT